MTEVNYFDGYIVDFSSKYAERIQSEIDQIIVLCSLLDIEISTTFYNIKSHEEVKMMSHFDNILYVYIGSRQIDLEWNNNQIVNKVSLYTDFGDYCQNRCFINDSMYEEFIKFLVVIKDSLE